MSLDQTQYTAKTLIDFLEKKGFIEENEAISDCILHHQQKEELPLYLRLAMGIGALFASLLFGIFMNKEVIFSEKGMDAIVWGMVFCLIAIAVVIKAHNKTVLVYTFFMQSSFTLMALGKFFFVFGLTQWWDSSWAISLGLLVITLLTYPYYTLWIDRFLSSCGVLISILMNTVFEVDPSWIRDSVYIAFVSIQLFMVSFLSMYGKLHSRYIPLLYAFSISLIVCIVITYIEIPSGHKLPIGYVDGLLSLFLMGLVYWIRKDRQQWPKEVWVLSLLGIVLIGYVAESGILFSIALLILGYAQHEKLLTLLGSLSLGFFLIVYYYNLELSLLYKSFVLMGTGGVLLLVRFYIRYRLQKVLR